MADPCQGRRMALWTDADVQALKVAVASGVLEVRFDGPPARQVRYHSLTEMRNLLASMQADVARSAGKPSYTVASTHKGFGSAASLRDPWERY